MNVILVTSSKNASGGSRQALYLASGLRERGHSVHFFSPVKSMLRPLAPDLPWHDLPSGFWSWKAALEGAMTPGESAIVHAFHNKAVKAAALFGTLWRLTGRPVACVAHRGVIYRPRNFLPYIAPGIRRFVVNSRACADTLPLLWRKDAVEVVYNCIPAAKVTPGRSIEEVRRELDIAPGARVIGCVGNNTPVKGLDVLIKAFAALKRSDLVLCLVGVRREVWEGLCSDLGVLDRVRLVPRTERVADYLQAFDLFVLPSLSESSPNTLLEAMCMGLPALGSRVGGVPECLSDPRFLVPAGDAQALAAGITGVIDDTAALNAAAAANKEFSLKLSVERKLDTMEALYANLLR